MRESFLIFFNKRDYYRQIPLEPVLAVDRIFGLYTIPVKAD
jgi:hypothetical protein